MTIKEEIALETVRSVNEPLSVVFNEDCMEGMKRYPDKYFDLAIVDPPYGIKINESIGRRKGQQHSGHKKTYWDCSIPDEKYFHDLLTASKNQIVWGGNYMTQFLKPSPCWILWDKCFSSDLTFSQFEMAWTSFNTMTKKFEMINNSHGKIHPTQKPVQLYEWILLNYAKPGDKILDTHVGSGSSRIAAYKHGFDYVGFEIDKDYFEAQEKRFNEFKAQLTLF